MNERGLMLNIHTLRSIPCIHISVQVNRGSFQLSTTLVYQTALPDLGDVQQLQPIYMATLVVCYSCSVVNPVLHFNSSENITLEIYP